MFSVGTNFDSKLIDSLKEYSIYEIYGKLPVDPIGGGIPSVLIKPITIKELAKEIDHAHEHDFKFNYLLNSTCLGNIEYSRKGIKKIIGFLDLLTKLKVDTLTIAIPFLAEFVKENYPHFKIDVSSLAGVNTVKRFKYWQDLGADTITLDLSANRNFSLIKNIINSNFKCDLKIMLNHGCELDCINYNYHSNLVSHQTSRKKQFPLEYCSVCACKLNKMKNLSALIRSPWIRPEDIKIYKNLGVKKFKIVQRKDPTDRIIRCVQAYQQEKYDGNLLDIMNFALNNHTKNMSLKKLIWISTFFIKPYLYNITKLLKNLKLFDIDFDLFVDNSKLDGFIDYFFNHDCQNTTCFACGYCDEIANKVISYNMQKRGQAIKNYETLQRLFLGKKTSLFL